MTKARINYCVDCNKKLVIRAKDRCVNCYSYYCKGQKEKRMNK